MLHRAVPVVGRLLLVSLGGSPSTVPCVLTAAQDRIQSRGRTSRLVAARAVLCTLVPQISCSQLGAFPPMAGRAAQLDFRMLTPAAAAAGALRCTAPPPPRCRGSVAICAYQQWVAGLALTAPRGALAQAQSSSTAATSARSCLFPSLRMRRLRCQLAYLLPTTPSSGSMFCPKTLEPQLRCLFVRAIGA